MHTGPLRIEDKKMSKSLKNFITVKDILKEFHPEVLRLFFLMTHYRSPISYSREGLENAKRVLDKFYTILSDKKTSSKFTEDKSFKEEFISVFQDDFNSPKAISILQVYARNAESEEDLEIDKFSTLKSLLNSLGLLSDETENYFKYGELDFSDDEIEKLISNRNDARESKNFDLADEIRNQLITKGIVLEDLGGKTIWKKKS
jgi:cysteinyl-tRNA synthetase